MIKYFGYYFPFAKMVEISTKTAFDFFAIFHPFLLLDIHLERPKMEGVNYPHRVLFGALLG
jgi:hypothetical protein